MLREVTLMNSELVSSASNGKILKFPAGTKRVESITARYHELGHASQTEATLKALADMLDVTQGTIKHWHAPGARTREHAAWRHGRKSGFKTSTTTTVKTFVDYVMDFGRFRGDTEYGIDPEQGSVRLEWVLNATNDTYFNGGLAALMLSVTAWVDIGPDAIAPTRSLRYIQVEEHVTATSEVVQTMPAGYRYHAICTYVSAIGGNEYTEWGIDGVAKFMVQPAAMSTLVESGIDTTDEGEIITSGYLTYAQIFVPLPSAVDVGPTDQMTFRAPRPTTTVCDVLAIISAGW